MPAKGLALGTVQWGLDYGIANRSGRPPKSELEAILACAKRSGISILDTARAYGQSETTIGELIAGDPHWTVVTKLDPDARTPDQAAASVEKSRRELHLEHLPLLLVHRGWQRTIDDGALWNKLRRLVDGRVIGALGVSAGNPDEAWQAIEDSSVTAVQVASNLLDRRLWQKDLFQAAHDAGKQVFVRSIFLQGVAHLGSKRLPASLSELIEPMTTIERRAESMSLTAADAFLAFGATLANAWILLGCETADQLCENVARWNVAAKNADAVERLAADLPQLPERLLDPSQWMKA